jgi:MFS transporter, PPP family, 3-phenylpropionic acid transporter
MTPPALPAHSTHIAARLGVFYAASFLVVGIQLPFWPVWLAGRGLDAREIATLFAAAIWAKVIATPAIGALADRLGQRRGVMVALAAMACAGYAAMWPAAGFWPLLWFNLIAGMAQSALMPLGDSLTLAAVRGIRLDYGRIRVWGSISFILAAIASGALLAHGGPAGGPAGGPDGSPAAAPGNTVLVLVLGASAVLLLACLGVPSTRAARGGGSPGGSPGASPGASPWAALARFAADRRLWLFIASGAALQSSHQLYYGFGTLYWRQLGFSDPVIGVLWAEGVVAEIVLFWRSGPLVARFGPLGLMAIGGIAGIVRWSLMGVVPGLAATALLQLLHGCTFGASHLGAMHFLARNVPPSAAASAQSLYAAVSGGLGSGLVMLAAGALYTTYGGAAYLFMALLSAAGLLGIAALARTAAR